MRPRLLGTPFFPAPSDNRMGNHGDVAHARELYRTAKSHNLRFLLEKRFEWLNDYIDPETGEGVELACGIGVTKDFVRARTLLLTDLDDHEWLDVPWVDATSTPFEDGRFDFVIIQNAIHHLAQPIKLFAEAARILKPTGVLLVRDVKCSLVHRAVTRLTRVEGYSYDVDVYDREAVMSDPANLWEANNAVPDLLFDDTDRFEQEVPEFRIVHQSFSECLVLLNSGGVTHKTVSIPLTPSLLRALHAVDKVITRRWPAVFATQRSIVLARREA